MYVSSIYIYNYIIYIYIYVQSVYHLWYIYGTFFTVCHSQYKNGTKSHGKNGMMMRMMMMRMMMMRMMRMRMMMIVVATMFLCYNVTV